MLTIAFDLDETLGAPITDGRALIGFQIRTGATDLLDALAPRFRLILWTVSSRQYATKCLSFGLARHFARMITWDDVTGSWKDLREVSADYLVDDSPHHRAAAVKHGLDPSGYIVIPAYGSPEDSADPLLWTRHIRASLQL